jgi:hypothetical protein
MAILQDMSKEQLIAMIGAMQQPKSGNGIKVFALGTANKDGVPYKGTLGVKTGRVGYTVLYASQWLKLLDKADAIRECIDANKDKLSWKESD